MEDSQLNHIKGIIEALLFVNEKSTTIEQIKKAFDTISAAEIKKAIEILKKDSSLSSKDIGRIITDAIAEYIIGTIGVLEFLELVDALESSKAKKTLDLKYIIEDLYELRQYKSDKQLVHSILINVLRKITRT